MLTRIISALVALPGALYLIYLGGLPFAVLMWAVVAICAHELASMTVPGDRVHAAITIALSLLLLLGVQTGVGLGPLGLVVGALTVVAVLLVFLFRLGSIETSAARMGYVFLGVAWAGGLGSAIAALRLLPEGNAWVLQACVLAWGSDTGAYFAGRFLGKKKLYEAVSPKKTWAGAIGGVISATLLALAFRHFLGPDVSLVELAVVAAVGTALGQTGDLCESLLKRSVGVKDSGRIMPGHGGLLDRIDALLFTAPFLLAYAVAHRGLTLEWLRL